MERKLVKQGRNALTVTLPAQWIKEHGLHAGDTVAVRTSNETVVVHVGQRSEHNEISLDLTGLEKSMMWHLMLGKYVEGYDVFYIKHNSPVIVQSICQKLIGMVIEEHSGTRTVLKSFVQVPENTTLSLIRRAGHMFLQQAVLVEDLTHGKCTYEEIKEHERLLDLNIFYILRYLNKYENQKHAYKYFLLCSIIELAADQLSHIAKSIGKNTPLAALVRKNIELYTRYLYTKNVTELYMALQAFRKAVPKDTFVGGLVFTLAEILYNNIGYLVSENEK